MLMYSDLEGLPKPNVDDLHCAFLKDDLCAVISKDPLTLVTNAWGALQLTWTLMLLFVHLFQVGKNLTTFESMRNTHQVNPVLSAMTTGTMSMDSAQITGAGAEPISGSGHKHAHRKKEGCLARWSKIIGLDTFFAIAFQGYKGTKVAKHKPVKKSNPFTRGLFRNCQDFWMDGPIFGRKESGRGLVGGEAVDYASMYEVPKGGMRYRGGGYEAVPGETDASEEEV